MLRNRTCFCILCSLLATILTLAMLFMRPATAAAQAPAPQGPVSFIKQVAPILKENCYGCHDAKKRKGKFDISTVDALRKGGDSGDPIADGKPDESHLMSVLTTSNPKRRMPPPEAGDPLPKDKLAVIEQWIKEGAKPDVPKNAELLRELRLAWSPPPPPETYKFPTIVNALAFTPDNKKIVVGGHHELTLWGVGEGKLEKRITTRAERAKAMLFLPDGKLVVAGERPGQEGDVRIYDINAGQPKMVNGVAVVDGVDPRAGVLLKELVSVDDGVLCLALSADGKKLAAGGCDRMVRVWDISDIANPKLVTEPPIENHADWVLGVAFAPDGNFLWTASRDKTVKVYDLVNKESVHTFQEPQPVHGVAVKQGGPNAAIGFSVGEDNTVRSYNFTITVTKDKEGKEVRQTDGKPRATLGSHGKPAVKIALHPSKPIMITGSADSTARLWNPDNNQAKPLAGHTDYVFAVALSPDGNLAASGSFNGEVRIWNVADAKLLKEFNASPGYVPPPQKK